MQNCADSPQHGHGSPRPQSALLLSRLETTVALCVIRVWAVRTHAHKHPMRWTLSPTLENKMGQQLHELLMVMRPGSGLGFELRDPSPKACGCRC